MKKLLLILALIVAPVAYQGCSTPPDSRVATYQTLKAVGHTAEAAVASTAHLFSEGQITAAQAKQVIDLYDNRFQPIYRVAVAAAQSNLDTQAAPELIALASQLASLVITFSQKQASITIQLDANDGAIVCPTCKSEGRKSTAIYQGSMSTLLASFASFDENGHSIPSSSNNTTTSSYRCSNGHTFSKTFASY